MNGIGTQHFYTMNSFTFYVYNELNFEFMKNKGLHCTTQK